MRLGRGMVRVVPGAIEGGLGLAGSFTAVLRSHRNLRPPFGSRTHSALALPQRDLPREPRSDERGNHVCHLPDRWATRIQPGVFCHKSDGQGVPAPYDDCIDEALRGTGGCLADHRQIFWRDA
jgi:hypothetical protein